MKISNINTGWVLIKAATDNEWDNCDFAIIRLTEEWLQIMKLRTASAIALQNDSSFYKHCYFESPEGFYYHTEDTLMIEAITEIQTWVFIELEKDDLKNQPKPENRLDCFQLSINRYGTAHYSALGKHTGNEYYTDGFNVHEWISQPKKSI